MGLFLEFLSRFIERVLPKFPGISLRHPIGIPLKTPLGIPSKIHPGIVVRLFLRRFVPKIYRVFILVLSMDFFFQPIKGILSGFDYLWIFIEILHEMFHGLILGFSREFILEFLHGIIQGVVQNDFKVSFRDFYKSTSHNSFKDYYQNRILLENVPEF